VAIDERRAEHLSPAKSALIGGLIAAISIFSGWMLAGRGWLRDAGAQQMQVQINTNRITALEANAKYNITREEHQQFIDRLTRLEANSPTRVEMQESIRVQDAKLQILIEQARNNGIYLTDISRMLLRHQEDTENMHNVIVNHDQQENKRQK
jgi:hypothetical protein